MDSREPNMLLSQPITLPCGLRLPNRLAKAAMAESMAPSHDPNEAFPKVYGNWADGGWGMVMTGNVIVSELYHGSAADVETSFQGQTPEQKARWKNWAAVCQRSGSPAIVQLNHPGRQSPLGAGRHGLFTKAVAPSPKKLSMGDSWLAHALVSLIFGTPRELTLEEIAGQEGIIEQFVTGARQCFDAGFKGVELHASHGYLLAQFMSSDTNYRSDAFGGTAATRVEIVLRIVRGIRRATSPEFCIGIKLNSVDASSSESLDDVMEQVQLIEAAGVDFLEISGGTYERPLMMQDPNARAAVVNDAPGTTAAATPKPSTLLRESFFLHFAQEIRRRFPRIVLMVTGGFRTRLGMQAALESGACDLIGLGRPATVLPKLPREILLNAEIPDDEARVSVATPPVPGWVSWIPIKAVGTGVQTGYFAGQIKRMSKGMMPIDSRI
ncbi:uncharacterized protein L3040_004819 [Drepanopeziza brunnea f. sp. 'multigermtubi']|uniref:uncharacterized protein n=1 Tax=Drepanopeziza brunnea f. sp. 'multigermtubi' TaxID=698441 RepID=UPI0023A586DD|nr:hypothetical protein L3040_004819 [Drepanopeziza brunnea f. sp. 'multigermtubi']